MSRLDWAQVAGFSVLRQDVRRGAPRGRLELRSLVFGCDLLPRLAERGAGGRAADLSREILGFQKTRLIRTAGCRCFNVEDNAKRIVKKYNAGQTYGCDYDPDHPHHIAMKDNSSGLISIYITGVFFLCLSVCW